MFISIDIFKKVTVLTNEVWTKKNEEEFNDEYSRHFVNDNFIWKLNYLTQAPEEEDDDKTPVVPVLNAYKLYFNDNVNIELDITDDAKVVEAHVHNLESRVTLVYKGKASYTFQLKPAKSLVEPSKWAIEHLGLDQKFVADLKFSQNRLSAEGSGHGEDEDKKAVNVKIDLVPLAE